jgi:hypothetical protein
MENKQDANGLVTQAHGGALKPGAGNRQGRKKGSKNKIPMLLKEAILAAAHTVGDFEMIELVAENGRTVRTYIRGPGGLQGYLEHVAMQHPKTYAGLLSRILPYQIVGECGGPVEVVYRTPDEVRAELKQRGLPIETIYLEHMKPVTQDNVEVAEVVENGQEKTVG